MFSPTKDILGDDFKGIDARVGDAAALPFRDEEFDLLVSIRFLRDIVTFDIAKQVMGEFSRICKKYAIIQLGQNTKAGFNPDPDGTMGGSLSATDIKNFFKDYGFKITDKRLVHSLKEENYTSEIYHYLFGPWILWQTCILQVRPIQTARLFSSTKVFFIVVLASFFRKNAKEIPEISGWDSPMRCFGCV